MNFTEACDYLMPFGKYKGQSLARIGANTDGLLYLDWLIGQDIKSDWLREAVKVYLNHPAIANQLNVAIED